MSTRKCLTKRDVIDIQKIIADSFTRQNTEKWIYDPEIRLSEEITRVEEVADRCCLLFNEYNKLAGDITSEILSLRYNIANAENKLKDKTRVIRFGGIRRETRIPKEMKEERIEMIEQQKKRFNDLIDLRNKIREIPPCEGENFPWFYRELRNPQKFKI